MTWSQRRVVITGASSGIGARLARRLASEGAGLTLGARNQVALQRVAQACVARWVAG